MEVAMLLFNSGKKLEKAFTEEQFAALVEVLEQRESNTATREDLRETELQLQKDVRETELQLQKDLRETELRLQLEIEKVRSETEKIRAELKESIEKVRADLTAEMEKMRTEAAVAKYTLLKWQFAIGLAIVCIMAKGFGWLGF